jgi:hypothetical protein
MDVQRLSHLGLPAERPAAPAEPAAPARSFGDVLASAAASAAGGAPQAGAPAPFAPGQAGLLAGPEAARPAAAPADAAAFVLVHRHGQEYHVYGTGKDRQVFPAPGARA